MAVVDRPHRIESDGMDGWDRPRWIVRGTAADGLGIELVCVLDTDDHGDVTVWVTLDNR